MNVGRFGRQIVRRLALVAGLVVAGLATTTAAAAANEMPSKWIPRTVAVNREAGNTFLLRPGNSRRPGRWR